MGTRNQTIIFCRLELRWKSIRFDSRAEISQSPPPPVYIAHLMASSNCLSLVLSPETVMLLLLLTCDQFPGQQYRKGKIIWIIFLGLLERREGGGSWLECSYRQVIAIWISYYVNSASEEIEQQWSRVQENCSFTIAKYSSSSS